MTQIIQNQNIILILHQGFVFWTWLLSKIKTMIRMKLLQKKRHFNCMDAPSSELDDAYKMQHMSFSDF
jgi:hypothetical protein